MSVCPLLVIVLVERLAVPITTLLHMHGASVAHMYLVEVHFT